MEAKGMLVAVLIGFPAREKRCMDTERMLVVVLVVSPAPQAQRGNLLNAYCRARESVQARGRTPEPPARLSF